jgi:kelch-like protein 2/3
VNSENVQDLLEATNFLQIKDLNQKCSDFMARNLDSSNCVAVLRLADTLSNDTLLQVAEVFWLCSYLCFASILASLVFWLR